MKWIAIVINFDYTSSNAFKVSYLIASLFSEKYINCKRWHNLRIYPHYFCCGVGVKRTQIKISNLFFFTLCLRFRGWGVDTYLVNDTSFILSASFIFQISHNIFISLDNSNIHLNYLICFELSSYSASTTHWHKVWFGNHNLKLTTHPTPHLTQQCWAGGGMYTEPAH